MAGLALVSVALFFTLRSHEKFGTDELLAGWFCLGTPLLLLGSALLIAALSDPRRRRGQPGFCPRCGEWLGGAELFCPQCGSSAAAWAVPPRMKTSCRPHHVGTSRLPASPSSPSRRQCANRSARRPNISSRQSLEGVGQREELTIACLADAATARRLYHVAARRLHPDSNQGQRLEDWDRLQAAMTLLRQLHRME